MWILVCSFTVLNVIKADGVVESDLNRLIITTRSLFENVSPIQTTQAYPSPFYDEIMLAPVIPLYMVIFRTQSQLYAVVVPDTFLSFRLPYVDMEKWLMNLGDFGYGVSGGLCETTLHFRL